MDSLITLLIFAALAAFSAWVKRKQNARDQFPPPEQRPPAERTDQDPTASSPPPQVLWEQELRRLLGQEPPPPPPPPPPLPVPEPPPVFRPFTPRMPETLAEETRPSPLREEAVTSQPRSINLQRRVTEQLHQALSSHPVARPLIRAIDQRPTQPALEVLRQPQTLRAAMIFSVILAPPKAFGEEKSL